ncbi:MAG TPA: hypothetical protein VGC54_08605 [Planctomycetota bacterium]
MLASLLLFAVLAPLSPCLQDPDPKAEFNREWDAALLVKDTDAMDKILRRQKEVGIQIFLNKAGARADYPSTDLNVWVDSFTAAWKRVFRSDFATNYDRYLQRLDSARRDARRIMFTNVWPTVVDLHATALGSQAGEDWDVFRRDGERFLESLTDVGDLYFLALIHNMIGNSLNPIFNKAGGDGKRAVELYAEALRLRKQLDLTEDLFYNQVDRVAADLRAELGIADPETGVVAAPRDIPERINPVEGSERAVVELAAGLERKPGAILHPSDLADDEHLAWQIGPIGAVGAATELPGLVPVVSLKRVKANEFVLEAGAEPSETFRLQPNPVVVTYLRKHEDGSESQHTLMLATGLEREDFHGAELNLSLGENGGSVFFRSIATRHGKSPWGEVTIFDTNCDGQFAEAAPQLVGVHGLVDGAFMYRYDSVMIGKGRRSVPFSKWVPDTKGDWFRLDVEDFGAGKQLALQPVQPRTGTVTVKFKGSKELQLTSLTLRSQTRHTENLLVDVMAGKGGTMEVPIGRYVVEQGLLTGKKGGEAILLPPAGVPLLIIVEEGVEQELELGGPFKIAAEIVHEGTELLVKGKSVHLTGVAGERYVRFFGAPLFDVEIAVKGGPTAELEASDSATVNADWTRGYLPGDAVLEVKAGTDLKVRLLIKKHPWFGNLDSGWIDA